jgi:integrase
MPMPQGKQAKMLTPKQETAVLTYLQTMRYPIRGRVMFLLSIKAGLRAKEIAALTWSMVTDADGQVGEVLALPNTASKGRGGGRMIPLNLMLHAALVDLHQLRGEEVYPDHPVVCSERGGPLTASSVTKWFFHLYRDLGMTGCSSHSGRRTFITRAARKVSEVGGSVRDVQQLAGHTSLQTTQRYIDGDTEAKRKLVQLI